MRRFLEIFRLELIAIVRTKTLAMLLAASVGWMLVFPYVVKGDGTAEGMREMYVRYSLGGVFALLTVTLLASATGALAKERAAKRLQLTLVRPVRYFTVALGKTAAYAAVGSLVLAVASALLALRTDLSVRCNHVFSPVMPTPREEALTRYDAYMKDPETPEAVKKAKKSVVLRILTQKALDYYQTVATNETATWSFPPIPNPQFPTPNTSSLSVRMRFTNQFEMRQELRGLFRFGNLEGTVSNITQAVLTVPLRRTGSAAEAEGKLSFRNLGGSALMLRPRKDLHLLAPADAFGWNLLRAWLEMSAVLALVIAFGMFLSASLGRPVALFVAIVVLLVSEMSPSVVEQYPDSLETDRLDRIGLALSRAAAEITHPISELSPLEALSKDECVETREVVRTLLVDLVAIPLFLSLLAAFVIPRKQDDL